MGGIFDAGDAAVLLDLESGESEEFSADEFSMEGLEALDEALSDSGLEDDGLLSEVAESSEGLDAELSQVLDDAKEMTDIEPPSIIAPPSTAESQADSASVAADDDPGASGSIELPEIS